MAARKKRVLTPEEQLEAALVPESEWPYEVPDNWCWVRLGTCISRSTEKSKTNDSNVLYVGLENFENGAGIVGYADASGTKSIKSVFRPGQILYGRLRPYLNKHDVAKVRGVCSTDILVYEPSEYSNAQYVNLFLDTKEFIEHAVSNSKGINLPRVSPTEVEAAFFPLPPLNEQQRIASRIEWLFSKLDDAEAKLREVIDSSEQRQAAILHSAFSGELTKTWRVVNGLGTGLESWQPTTSDELFEYVTSGSRGWAKYYSDTGAVFLRMGNLDHGTIELDLSDIQHVELPDRAEGQRSLVKKDDILISITADVGMIGFVRNIDYEAYINQHVALARPTQPKSAEFIAWYLVSDMGFVQLRQKQRGVTKVGLGLDDIRSLTLLMPTESEQELILESINSCMDNEARMVEAAEKAIGSIHKTRQSILNQALHGELGTNDPDEPSSKELLASILSGNAGK